jgi:hypothetical protein
MSASALKADHRKMPYLAGTSKNLARASSYKEVHSHLHREESL